MPLFRREPEAPKDFWSWWATASDRVAAAIDAGTGGRNLVGEITAAVKTIHPEMALELAPGQVARHAFCITPEGRADLRRIALRWLETTPAPGATWQFHASRQPSAKLGLLQVAGAKVDLTEVRAITSWDPTRRRIDIYLWHPALPQLPQQARLQVAFLFLDNLLGEDEVERWIGRIDTLDAPAGGRTPDELRAEVERHRNEPADDATWVLGQLDGPDGPAIVSANAALKRIDYPFAGIHVTVRVAIPGGGMPTDADAARLNAEEDDLVRRFEAIGAFRLLEAFWIEMHRAPLGLDRLRRPLLDRLETARAAGLVAKDLDVDAATNLVFGASLLSAITLRVNAHVDRERLDRDLSAAIDILTAGLAKAQPTLSTAPKAERVSC